jgi:hypothetical protein
VIVALINFPEIKFVDPLDRHLVQGDGRSTYKLAHVEKSAGRIAWEFWASHVLLMVKVPEFDIAAFREWKRMPISDGARKTNGQKLDELRMKWPDLSSQIDDVMTHKD